MEPRRPGRPRTPPAERATVELRVYVTPEEATALRLAAGRAESSLSSWLGGLGLREAGRPGPGRGRRGAAEQDGGAP